MSASETAATGRIRLASDQPGLEFSVRDAGLAVVGSAVGRLDLPVRPGLYRIEERAGRAERAAVVAVRAGEVCERTGVVLPFPCVAPVSASAAAPPGFAGAVEEASETAVREHGAGAAVLIVAVSRAAAPGDDPAAWEVLDDACRTVATGHPGGGPERVDVGTRRLPAGGYLLRAPGATGAPVDRPVWLADGWQTIVFQHANHDGAGVSVHMVPAGVPWRADDPAHTAVEAAAADHGRERPLLRGTRADDAMVSRNPVLGLLGAHALRRASRPDADAYAHVVRLLQELLPGHPDVRALAPAGSGRPVWWPPLLAASYRELLDADLSGRAAVKAGSPAERIAAYVVPSGPWLAWLRADEACTAVTAAEPPPPRAAERVRSFVQTVARFERRSLPDVVAGWDEASIAQSTGLPLRTVGAVLAALGRRDPAARRSPWSLRRRTARVERAPLTYAGAVAMLAGEDGALFRIATWFLDAAVLALFDTRSEVTAAVRALLAALPRKVGRATGNHRVEVVAAAHTVLVLSALLDAVDGELGPHAAPELTAWDRTRETWSSVAMPSATVSFEANLRERLRPAVRASARACAMLLSVEPAGFTDRVGQRWERLYRERYLRLAADVPEFATWVATVEPDAARRRHDEAAARLRDVLDWLDRWTGLSAPADRSPVAAVPARLMEIHRAALGESLLGGLQPAGDPASPTVAQGWVEPHFRAAVAGPGTALSGDGWWSAQKLRDGLGAFLAGYLSSPGAAEQPMIVAGAPGAGKSTLTRIVCGRLSDADRLVIPVVARHVDPGLPVRRQLEGAAEALLGEWLSWDDLTAQAPRTIVVVVDGLDEVLDASGDVAGYLARMQQFQAEQLRRGRRVAALVTARTMLLDQLALPAGSPLLRLEPFDETQIGRWVSGWNLAHAHQPSFEPFTGTAALRHGELAANPLLLSLLAIHHSLRPEPAAREVPLTVAGLYRELLDVHIARQLGTGRPDSRFDEYRWRLGVAACGMVNRSAAHVSRAELHQDLAVLGRGRQAAAESGRLSPDAFDAFFSTRIDDGENWPRQYVFLHETFAEFLVAEQLLSLVRRPDDGLLRALTSHVPLLSRRPVVMFLQQLIDELDPGQAGDCAAVVDGMLAAARHDTDPRYRDYAPRPVDIVRMTACHTANLMTLRLLLSGGSARLRDVAPPGEDPGAWWQSTVRLWRAGLEPSAWRQVVTGFTVDLARTAADRHVNLADADTDLGSDVAFDLAEVTLLAGDPVGDPVPPAAERPRLDAG